MEEADAEKKAREAAEKAAAEGAPRDNEPLEIDARLCQVTPSERAGWPQYGGGTAGGL